VGSTLKYLQNEHPAKFNRLQQLLFTDPFVRYVLTNIDTSLAATDETIINQYSSLVEDHKLKERILLKILAELELTRKMMSLLIVRPLQERRTSHYYSTLMRADALENLHISQIRLLREWRKNDSSPNPEELINLLKSINAIANAMGNTG